MHTRVLQRKYHTKIRNENRWNFHCYGAMRAYTTFKIRHKCRKWKQRRKIRHRTMCVCVYVAVWVSETWKENICVRSSPLASNLIINSVRIQIKPNDFHIISACCVSHCVQYFFFSLSFFLSVAFLCSSNYYQKQLAIVFCLTCSHGTRIRHGKTWKKRLRNENRCGLRENVKMWIKIRCDFLISCIIHALN